MVQDATSVCAFDENAKDVSSSVDTQMAAPELKEAASIVSDHVNRLAGRVQSSLASSDRYMPNIFFCLSCSLGRWTSTRSSQIASAGTSLVWHIWLNSLKRCLHCLSWFVQSL